MLVIESACAYAEVIILQWAECAMAIREGRPQHAFNLLPKCDECRQQSGHLNFIYFYPKKWEEICKWSIISCGDSSLFKMKLSWKLKAIQRRHYLLIIEMESVKWKTARPVRTNKLFHEFQFEPLHRCRFHSDPISALLLIRSMKICIYTSSTCGSAVARAS